MDHITNNKTYTASTSSSSSWDLDMTMANPLLLDHHHHQQQHHLTGPFEFFHPNSMVDHLHFPPAPQLINPHGSIVPQELLYDDEAEDDDDNEDEDVDEEEQQQLGAMKEMMYKIAAMQPVDIDPSTIKKPKRRNVRISEDPQSVAARHRRERISERIRILQRLVPGGTKMDTASMLDEAIRYVKFLKRQLHELQQTRPPPPPATVLAYASLASPPPPPSGAGISSSGLGFAFNVGHGTNNFR